MKWWSLFPMMRVGGWKRWIVSDVTVPEAAKLLGVTDKDVYAYIASGELSAWNKTADPHTTRPRYRIPVEAVEEFKRRRMVKPKCRVVRPRRWRRNLDVL